MSEMVERVGEALRQECLKIFGSTWNNDNAWRLARAAIGAMREPTEAMCKAVEGADIFDAEIPWGKMIDEALK